MGYKIKVTELAENEIYKKLELHLIDRVNKKIQKLSLNPDLFGKPLRSPMSGIWEIRFEKRWRILYKIIEKEKTVWIVGFKHKDEM